jgi:hypothetical protein
VPARRASRRPRLVSSGATHDFLRNRTDSALPPRPNRWLRCQAEGHRLSAKSHVTILRWTFGQPVTTGSRSPLAPD